VAIPITKTIIMRNIFCISYVIAMYFEFYVELLLRSLADPALQIRSHNEHAL